MSYYFDVAYGGSTPGANTNTYVLVNTTSVPGTGPLRPSDFRRYLLSLNNAAAGTLNVYGSNDAGVSWKSIYTVAVAAATSQRNNEFAIPTLPHHDVKAEWVNGGSAQTTWVVVQAFDDGMSEFRPAIKDAAGDSDGGVSTTVDSAQLPSSLGQKAMAASLAVVVASNQTVIPVSDNAGSLTVDSSQLPAALGQTNKAGSLSVALASNQDALPVTDNAGSLTVDSAQLPSALGQTTKSASLPVTLPSDISDLPIKQGTPAKTDNTTYIAAGNMSADVDGPAITVGPEGRLLMQLAWSNTGSPIGAFVLQGLLPDASTYDDIPSSGTAFLRHPNADTNTSVAYFRELQVFTSVRLKYRRTSGGTANTSLVVKTRTS